MAEEPRRIEVYEQNFQPHSMDFRPRPMGSINHPAGRELGKVHDPKDDLIDTLTEMME